ncbi:MAG TPA: hypothetical protein VEG30_12715 [Terriglobales bacterium]|nr:hypothetical protein [Terriglobales bacterium]
MKKWQQRREHVSEAFHSLNQPLTALHCVIELALLQPRSGEEYRMRLRESLQLVDRIFEFTAGVREFVEAEDPGLQREFAIGEVLREVTKKHSAIAGARIELKQSYDAVVTADFERLCKGLICLLEQFHADGISVIKISTGASGDAGEIEITIGGEQLSPANANSRSGADDKLGRLRLTAAMLALEAGGGRADYCAPNYAQLILPVIRLIPQADCEAGAAAVTKDLHPSPVQTGP